ncbi:hypothetical protein SARC_06266 [Sphaeroforma arctica JP610]|uniref:Uncharacterized protein n=1 Tax=Sphaeroforma arctica JP610 TaxID=667725 RepID=A0A0L0FX43_9EUKA|nr:hypothetical protein SARC_06266 [Sphaeroforma arctica JP610]KNC81402.1 hypothetical protein SARC_06266 [Sphaeroforma arctica JP610]|eukprot:XP_014155304.1 hypothetical protein SARC_06266 [Sphaeroforma arctica JP610]
MGSVTQALSSSKHGFDAVIHGNVVLLGVTELAGDTELDDDGVRDDESSVDVGVAVLDCAGCADLVGLADGGTTLILGSGFTHGVGWGVCDGWLDREGVLVGNALINASLVREVALVCDACGGASDREGALVRTAEVVNR